MEQFLIFEITMSQVRFLFCPKHFVHAFYVASKIQPHSRRNMESFTRVRGAFFLDGFQWKTDVRVNTHGLRVRHKWTGDDLPKIAIAGFSPGRFDCS